MNLFTNPELKIRSFEFFTFTSELGFKFYHQGNSKYCVQ